MPLHGKPIVSAHPPLLLLHRGTPASLLPSEGYIFFELFRDGDLEHLGLAREARPRREHIGTVPNRLRDDGALAAPEYIRARDDSRGDYEEEDECGYDEDDFSEIRYVAFR